ncbi:MAG: DUF5666 domain-containing protein [Candidatus Tectimicrobiota bacterium]
MHLWRVMTWLGLFLLCSAAVEAQTTARVRGTITAFEGNTLAVHTREGQDVQIALTEQTSIASTKALSLADLQPGVGLGTSALKRPDGTLVALEVHVFAPDRGVPNEGHRPWDLQPESTMTNARVSAMVESANGRELTLTYKDGMQKLLVPEGVPIVTAGPGDRTLLRPGEYVYVAANVGTDGAMTATRIQVSKDGVKPPQ